MLAVLAKFTEKQWMIAVQGGGEKHRRRNKQLQWVEIYPAACPPVGGRCRAIPTELAGDRDFHLGMVAFGPTAACVAGMYAPTPGVTDRHGRLPAGAPAACCSPLYSDRGFMLSLVTAGWQAALVAAANAPPELLSDREFMRAVVDAQPTQALKAPGAWHPAWPRHHGMDPLLAGREAVRLDHLARFAAAQQQVFHTDQEFMLAVAARGEVGAEGVRSSFSEAFCTDRDFIRLAATVSELTHSQPAHSHAICTAMARGVPAAQAVETVMRNQALPLMLVALNGDSHPLTDWHADPTAIIQNSDRELLISDMDWIALARRQHPELGDAPFQIVLDDEAADGTVSGKFATVQDEHKAAGTLLARSEPPRAVLVWTNTDP